MWTAYLDTNPARVLMTRAAGLLSRRAYYGTLSPLRTRKLPQPGLPGSKWVRVRNHMAGISGAELELIRLHTDPRIALMAIPRRQRIYLGRESSGEVIEVGPNVEFLQVGDRVAYQLDQCCATRDVEPPCRHCAAGNYSLCETRYLPGSHGIGGGWGDEMIVHESQLFLVPDGLSDEQATLLEPSAVAVHAALRHLPGPEESALIIGSGTLGLLLIQAVRAFVPNANIVALARHPFQVELATRAGANHIMFAQEGTTKVAQLTGAKTFQAASRTRPAHWRV